MAIAKKAAAKRGKKEAPEKMKLVVVVMETVHGGMFGTHKHHDVQLLELPVSFETDNIARAAKKATRIARNLLGVRSRVLLAEEVKIKTTEDIKDGADRARKIMGENNK